MNGKKTSASFKGMLIGLVLGILLGYLLGLVFPEQKMLIMMITLAAGYVGGFFAGKKIDEKRK